MTLHRFASLLAAGALTLAAGLASQAAAQDASDSIDVGVRLMSTVTLDASATVNLVSCPVLHGSVGTWITGDEACARGAADGITFFETFTYSSGSLFGRAAPNTPDGQFSVSLTLEIELTDPLINVGVYDADILVMASYQ